jgi:hypothetical protein
MVVLIEIKEIKERQFGPKDTGRLGEVVATLRWSSTGVPLCIATTIHTVFKANQTVLLADQAPKVT